MTDLILANETLIRLGFFAAMLALVAVWEVVAPRRAPSFSRLTRWPGNLGVVALNAAALRVVFPVAAVGVALSAETRGWGLAQMMELPYWLTVALAVVILDFAIYLQHVMVHAVPLLWRLHRMHHADLDYDVTTGARFHPIEIVLSMAIKLAVITLIGAPALAVVIFEVLLNATAMFNHGNIRLPLAVDRILRWLVVTPDMHRVHHSIVAHETNSNFGFNLPWWDRLMGTYRDQPAAGHQEMVIGIADFRSPDELRLDRMLIQPFRRIDDTYAINAAKGVDRKRPPSTKV